ncbi:MAG: NmrA family protein [Bacteroidetes bacterium OLB12]|nr:MAG: NmrA family protein [Bacteroidetes bacterium OLB12]MCE7864108.1 NAD(P)-dependent oxidoreductase [Bacteroidetes bacterium CHB5]
MNNIAIAGGTGMLGWPVATALAQAGFTVTALTRTPQENRNHPNIRWVVGDLQNTDSIRKLLEGNEAVHLNLSVKQNETQTDWHAEEQGLENLLRIAREQHIKHISYLSSLIMNYQGMNGFDWWVFRLKQRAVAQIRDSGISATVFYPSTFMETLLHQYKAGPFMLLAGQSKHKQYFVAAEDYAQQVVQSYKQEPTQRFREYIVQGQHAYTTDEAIAIFKQNTPARLMTLRAPLGLIKFYGGFFAKMNYGYHILEALNNYPEKFEAEATWQQLGKPSVTLEQFSKRT